MVNGIGKKVFILGIGGISLSAMAEILKSFGHEVKGFDRVESTITTRLEADGIPFVEQAKNSIIDADTIIYTGAIREDSPELIVAKNLSKQILTRADALSLIAESYKTVVAVSGSHGKTTATAIISSILSKTCNHFTSHIGGELVESGLNYEIKGEPRLFVTEACEYQKSFLTLKPTIGVILNLDLDHTDTYPTEDDLIGTFIEFSNNITGTLVINKDDRRAQRLILETAKAKKIVTYSLQEKNADYYAEVVSSNSGQAFDVYFHGKKIGEYIFPRGGKHNIYNALVGIIVAKILNIPDAQVKNALLDFKGVKRRYEKIGEINGAPVILDYAHHPAEIEKVIIEAKGETQGKVFAVFQPHTYSRTKSFWSGFVKSLCLADSVVTYPIYPARERQIRGVTSERLAEDIRRLNHICYYNDSKEEILTYLGYFVKPEDRVLILGAGDIEKFRDLVKSNNIP